MIEGVLRIRLLGLGYITVGGKEAVGVESAGARQVREEHLSGALGLAEDGTHALGFQAEATAMLAVFGQLLGEAHQWSDDVQQGGILSQVAHDGAEVLLK